MRTPGRGGPRRSPQGAGEGQPLQLVALQLSVGNLDQGPRRPAAPAGRASFEQSGSEPQQARGEGHQALGLARSGGAIDREQAQPLSQEANAASKSGRGLPIS